MFVQEALAARGVSLWEAFSAFDADNNGVLSPAEVFGALLWLEMPSLAADDVVDFIESADTNRDGFIDYKEYMDLLSEEDGNADESTPVDPKTDKTATSSATSLAKIVPHGADELREVILHRKQHQLSRQKEERARKHAYKAALDAKLFEEELIEASRTRKGGQNPLCKVVNNLPGFEAVDVTVGDFLFDSNQLPVRCVLSGKSMFMPINIGTAADKDVLPMRCPKNSKHELESCNYYWWSCTICRKSDVKRVCWSCNVYICGDCFAADRREKEAAKRDPSKHPTFLRCLSTSFVTIQVPTAGAANANEDYSISLDFRVLRLPPAGHMQSLLRFPLPDLAQARKVHRTSIYLTSEGRVVAQPLEVGGEVEGSTAKVIAGYWATITVVASPRSGVIKTYINGRLCHESVHEAADIRLQAKVVVLGGGKQAHARGGDIRRISIHGNALGPAAVTTVSDQLLSDNPGVGGRIVKFQARFRGFIYRIRNNIVLKKKSGDEDEDDEDEDDEDEDEKDSDEDSDDEDGY